jgi:hypothetical protein
MPKPYTFPSMYDECLTISISKLKEWGYLKDKSQKSGIISWSRNGTTHSSVSIMVNTWYGPYLQLDYKYNGKPIKYKVWLTSKQSNLGKGMIYYFLCPHTGKRCRVLYSIDTYFLHRLAFRGAMYECQTYSKYARSEIKVMKRLFGTDQAYEKLNSKYFKKKYAGRPTKRYLRLLDELR